jgi:predicted RND superfamily exporter protein
MWELLARFILRQRFPILVVILLLTLYMGFMALNVRLQWDMPKLLPDKDSTLVDYENFRARYGQDVHAFLFAIDENPLEDLVLFNQWYDLAIRLNSIGGVDTVLSVNRLITIGKDTAEKKFFLTSVVDHRLSTEAELDSVRALVESLPFYRGRLYNPDNGVNLMATSLKKGLFTTPERDPVVDSILHEVQVFEEKSNLHVHLSGMPYIRSMTTRLVKEELSQFIALVVVVMIIILSLFFRSGPPVYVSVLIVAFAVVWSFGILAVFDFEITILTGIIPPLIIVIGIPNSVYLINRYHSEYTKHGNKVLAISRVVRKIGRATFMTNLTTAIGFLTFTFTQSTVLVEFGLVAFVNIMVIFALSIFLIPAIFSFLPPPKESATKHLERKAVIGFVQFLIRLIRRHRSAVYVTSAVLVILGFIGISQIQTTGNLVDDLPSDHGVVQDLRYYEENFNGIMPFEINIDTQKPGKADKTATLKRLERLQKMLQEYPCFGPSISIVDGIKFLKQAYYNGNPDKYSLLTGQEATFVKRYADNTSGNAKVLESYIDSTKQHTRLSVQMRDVGTLEMDSILAEIRPRVDSIFNPEKYTVSFTGPGIVYLKGTTYLVRNLFISLALAVFIIGIIMATLFRSTRMIALSILVNLIPLLLTGAMMGFFGIPLKPSTILIFSIAFGISIDDTIHFLAKYRQELDLMHWDLRTAVYESIRETGVSMMYTSIILFFGFAVFASSNFGGTQALGVLTSITLLIAMLVNLVLLPSILLSMGKRITTKAFREPFIEVIDEETDIDFTGLSIPPEKDK